MHAQVMDLAQFQLHAKVIQSQQALRQTIERPFKLLLKA